MKNPKTSDKVIQIATIPPSGGSDARRVVALTQRGRMFYADLMDLVDYDRPDFSWDEIPLPPL